MVDNTTDNGELLYESYERVWVPSVSELIEWASDEEISDLGNTDVYLYGFYGDMVATDFALATHARENRGTAAYWTRTARGSYEYVWVAESFGKDPTTLSETMMYSFPTGYCPMFEILVNI